MNLYTCPECGLDVPQANLTLHQLQSCTGRARRSSEQNCGDQENKSPDPNAMDVDDVDSHDSNSRGQHVDIDDSHDSSHLSEIAAFQSESSRTHERSDSLLETPSHRPRRRQRRLSYPPDSQNQPQVIIDVDSIPTPNVPPTRPTVGPEVIDCVESPDPVSEQWPCPQCTLLNSRSAPRCDACHFPNPDRPPDPTRSERLVEGDVRGRTRISSPIAIMGGGALMGGLLGAAHSYVAGIDTFSGAMEGAFTGVTGGVLINEVLQPSDYPRRSIRVVTRSAAARQQQQQQPSPPLTVAQARTSSSITGGYPSIGVQDNDENASNRPARPRSSFRVSIQQDPPNPNASEASPSTTTIVMGGSRATRIRRMQRNSQNSNGPGMIEDPMMSVLLHYSLMQDQMDQQRLLPFDGRSGRRSVYGNIDAMTYDQLIEAFGDGSDNMGAAESQIQQLPTHTVTDPQKELPQDARQCLICLEDFCAGESRKTLPCLHGYHTECCDKWLRTNGSCPICKHRIR